MEYTLKELNDIFSKVRETLIQNSEYSLDEFNEKVEEYKHLEGINFTDNDYYKKMVYITFYSGFRASTVEKFKSAIENYFPNYEKVMFYDEDMFNKIANDNFMIKNKQKIRACINNAQKVNEIVKEYGSFENYINHFGPHKNDTNLFKLKKDLKKFDFLDKVTVYHFMMDIGLNVLKPDRVLMRIFERLNLIYDEDDLFGVTEVGRLFSEATELPIRYIDIIFVLYGQLTVSKIKYICSEKEPDCNICGVKMYCNYNQSDKGKINNHE
jgi:DNA-3-methyladenine glycosylase I